MTAAKRALDMLLSGVGLLISLPLWALIALAIKLDDGGPVLFAQERVGRGGHRFRVFKFRSMIPDAEAGIGARQATDGDPRTTRVGRWLRPFLRAMAVAWCQQYLRVAHDFLPDKK